MPVHPHALDTNAEQRLADALDDFPALGVEQVQVTAEQYLAGQVKRPTFISRGKTFTLEHSDLLGSQPLGCGLATGKRQHGKQQPTPAMAPKQPEAVGMSPAAKPDRMDKPMAAAAQMTDRHSMAEPPPWEDWPDTTDYADQGSHAAASGHTEAPAPALRSLPVREASEPSARVDIPRQTTPAAVETTPEGSVWLEAVQGLMAQEAITALVRELALQSQLLARDADQWHLRVERETLNHAASRERLQAALLAAGHGDVKLHIEIGPVTDSPAKRLAVLAAAKMVAAQELIQSDPLVQAMVRDFGARIVPGSIQLI